MNADYNPRLSAIECGIVPHESPVISVIVPALNEERCIEPFLDRVSSYLSARRLSWELVVVDDGSVDGTAAIVERRASQDRRIRLLRQSHRGKGLAVRRGMLAAQGRWRFMADADLSVAPEGWAVLIDGALAPVAGQEADVIVASREAAGAQRIGEPVTRHAIGRIFNWIVQIVTLRGINDTQCGFKLFSAAAATTVLPRLTIEGFAFDVEALFLARRAGFRIREVGVVWTCRADSRVRVGRGAAAFADVVRIRWRQLRGRYDGLHVLPVHNTPTDSESAIGTR
jgi:glycosyltransferase involved in cell wall biosynthesis